MKIINRLAKFPDFGGIIPILSHQPESRYRVRKNGINPDFQQILPKISMLSRFSSRFKSYFGSVSDFYSKGGTLIIVWTVFIAFDKDFLIS